MASLANQTISSSYDGLVKTATDQPVGVSGVQLLEDGVGNSLALSVGRANQGVTVTGTLTATTVTGTLSATSVLANGVIATTQATSDNSTKVATTAYVKSVVTAEDLDIAGTTGTGSVDLDSQVLTIAGTANEIETSASGQTITIGLPSTITANVTGNVSGNLTGNVAGDLTGTVLTAAQANITSVGTLSSLAVSGNLAVDTNTLFVDSVNKRVGVGTNSSAFKLEVKGGSASTLLLNNDGSQFTQLLFENNSTSNSGGDFLIDHTNSLFKQRSLRGGQAVTFETSVTNGNPTERMRIDSSGNVGIGTSSPSVKLEVADSYIRVGSSANVTQDNTLLEGYGYVLGGTYYGLASIKSGYNNANNHGNLKFFTTGADGYNLRMTLNTAGNLVFPNGQGIDFSATAGGGATSSLLDDYEEGTFTVTLAPNTGTISLFSTANKFTYTKIGQQVSITGLVAIQSVSSPTGNLQIQGLPFSTSASTSKRGSASVVYLDASAGYAVTNVPSYTGQNQTSVISIISTNGFAVDDEIAINFSYFI